MAIKKFGNIRVLKSGRVQARYYLPTGEQVPAGTFDTKHEAQNRLDEIEVDLRRGAHWDGRKGKTKFRDFIHEYMDHRQKVVSPGELANNRSYLSVYLLPAFGHLPMEQLDEETIDRWFAAQPPTETRRNVYAFLRRSMRFAVKWKYLRTSPCNVLDPGKGMNIPRPTWTREDFEGVLQYVPEYVRVNNGASPTRVYYREALEIMFSAHLRLGELIALNANDYVRKTKLITVERQVTGLGLTTDTKTGQHKTIHLLAPGVSAIDRLPTRIGTMALVPGARVERMPRVSLQRAWSRAVKEAGLSNFHIHDIRHIGLSMVAATGVPMKDVMTRGGHASLQSAMRYQHTDMDRDRAAAEATDRLFGNG